MTKSRFTLLTIAALAFCLSLPLAADAQRVKRSQAQAFPPGPCRQNTRLCLRQMNAQISQLRAYVAHVKPGDPVKFNPQPDPPGDPDPWYRRASEAYRSLQAEFADLSSEIPNLRLSPEKLNAGRNAVGGAQEQLSRLGQVSDRNSANATLNELSASVRRLSDSLHTPLLRNGKR
jgi:hypothetical protein